MAKMIHPLCLSLVLLVTQTDLSNGSFCTKTGSYYAAQHYCVAYHKFLLWNTGCYYYAYRRVIFYEKWRECCPGYKGKDCTTPICLEPCSPGHVCSSPDMCTVDPLAPSVFNIKSTDLTVPVLIVLMSVCHKTILAQKILKSV
uniref:Uncharacterized protein LOC111118261 n=1 Tax=Crassostrea virginica TaxID=6565 RepID=A0A8B8CDU5_CRAVI|nr:uncharacterized protein LOC111118261 [Crassostrea virginica]